AVEGLEAGGASSRRTAMASSCGIPGVDRIVAWSWIAELGVDRSVSASADQCASWAGLVPGDNESAGKQISTRCRSDRDRFALSGSRQ
ncbi:MAG: IS110 family transposase, partial [Bryobacter sp.]|nr:IS110 family transposase [Bryobacter sp.]